METFRNCYIKGDVEKKRFDYAKNGDIRKEWKVQNINDWEELIQTGSSSWPETDIQRKRHSVW